VKKVKPDGSKTLYIAGLYEVDKTSGGTVTQTRTYYPVGGATLAPGASAGVRINGTLYFMVSTRGAKQPQSTQRLQDHLSSTSVMTDASGTTVGEDRFYPYGETRFTTGTMYTDKLFTGQREETGLGIYHYGARFYSPKLGRFLSPDTIVPSYTNPQAWNRYSYVLGNPLRYTDPTGHAQYEDPYESSDGTCAPGDTSCNWVGAGSNNNSGNDQDGVSGETDDSLLNLIPENDGSCSAYDPYCANVSYDQLDYYVNNTFKAHQTTLWVGAGMFFLLSGVALSSCAVTALLGCGVGLLLAAEGVELTAEANEASSVSGYLQSELGSLNPGETTTISLDYTDQDSNFFLN